MPRLLPNAPFSNIGLLIMKTSYLRKGREKNTAI